jgi:hypothetical protein
MALSSVPTLTLPSRPPKIGGGGVIIGSSKGTQLYLKVKIPRQHLKEAKNYLNIIIKMIAEGSV